MSNNETLKISIIIPVYNVQEYLEKCLLSVMKQKYKNFEVIIIDDGSSDNSQSIYRKFLNIDSRIIVRRQKNQGISDARNAGIKASTGDYIFFLDADDWIEPDYINNCVKVLEYSNTDLLITPYIREYKKLPVINNLMDRKDYSFANDEVRTRLLRRLIGEYREELMKPAAIDDYSPVWGKFYKATYCKNISFTGTDFIGNEDTWFNINYVLQISSARYYGNEYYHYNKQNSNSFVTKYNPNLYGGWKRLYGLIKKCIINNDFGYDFYEALNNRIIIDLMALVRNVLNSSLSYLEKRKIILNILNDDLYKKSFNIFKYDYVPIEWKIFFKLCQHNQFLMIYILLKAAEPFKAKLK